MQKCSQIKQRKLCCHHLRRREPCIIPCLCTCFSCFREEKALQMVKRTNQWIDRSDGQTFLQRHGSLLIMLYKVLSAEFLVVCLSVGPSVSRLVKLVLAGRDNPPNNFLRVYKPIRLMQIWPKVICLGQPVLLAYS